MNDALLAAGYQPARHYLTGKAYAKLPQYSELVLNHALDKLVRSKKISWCLNGTHPVDCVMVGEFSNYPRRRES